MQGNLTDVPPATSPAHFEATTLIPAETILSDFGRWVSIPMAARLSGITDKSLRRLADKGMLSVRRLPGGHPKLNYDEVVTLTLKHTKPASVLLADTPVAASA